ncbi:MAG: LppX_LprAFG lipoprotein, partial [Chloroflexota bacterium]|nr:LppX_LprAFG lipoprotein [Chloroflexota bacterium]
AGLLNGMTDLQRGPNEKIDGVDCYRISGKAGGAALQPVLGVAASAPLQLTAWVGTSDFFVRQLVIAGAILPDEPKDTKRTLKIGQFNAPVAIKAPTT